MNYVYGMRMRCYAPGCQPKKGLLDWRDTTPASGYYSLLLYDRKLSKDEYEDYELDLLYKCAKNDFSV